MCIYIYIVYIYNVFTSCFHTSVFTYTAYVYIYTCTYKPRMFPSVGKFHGSIDFIRVAQMKYPSIKKVSESRAKSLFLIKKGKPWEKNGFRTLIFQRRKGTINTCLPKKNHYINIFNKWMVSYRNSPKKNVQNGPRLPNKNSN